MRRYLAIILLVLATSCSAPGMRVLTGQPITIGADPSADRIEANTQLLDVIEATQQDGRLEIYALFAFPEVASADEAETVLKQVFDTVAEQSDIDSGSLVIYLLQAQPIYTIEHGLETIGIVFRGFAIDVGDMDAYLSGLRTMDDYKGLIADEKLQIYAPDQTIIYTRQPNHPLRQVSSGPQS